MLAGEERESAATVLERTLYEDDELPLALGASGPLVEEAHERLGYFGYFPSVVERPTPPLFGDPPDPSSFDVTLERALALYQKQMGLNPSGILDRTTLDSLRNRMCGVADYEPASDTTQKWAHFATTWPEGTLITYRFATAGALPGMANEAATRTAILNGITMWNNPVELDWVNWSAVGSGENLRIEFVPLTGFMGFYSSGNPNRLQFDSDGSTTFNAANLTFTAAHEFGHAIRLDHSSRKSGSTQALMYPSAVTPPPSSLTDDDMVSANVAYNYFDETMGACCAIDLDVASVSNADKIWRVSSNGTPQELVAGSFVSRSGVTATRIAVCSNNNAWVVTNTGAVSQYNGSSWTTRPTPGGAGAGAHSIACGEGQTNPWALSSVGKAWQWNGASWVDRGGGGGLLDIDVTPGGVPYVVTTGAEMGTIANSTWTKLTASNNSSLKAVGIGGRTVGGLAFEWIYGIKSNNTLVIYAKQTAIDAEGSASDAPDPNKFQLVTGTGNTTQIALGARRPYALVPSGNILRREEL